MLDVTITKSGVSGHNKDSSFGVFGLKLQGAQCKNNPLLLTSTIDAMRSEKLTLPFTWIQHALNFLSLLIWQLQRVKNLTASMNVALLFSFQQLRIKLIRKKNKKYLVKENRN